MAISSCDVESHAWDDLYRGCQLMGGAAMHMCTYELGVGGGLLQSLGDFLSVRPYLGLILR